jgi:hypothetical protein
MSIEICVHLDGFHITGETGWYPIQQFWGSGGMDSRIIKLIAPI